MSDSVRLQGSGRYALGQSEAHAIADMRRELDALEMRFPGLQAILTPERTIGRVTMPPFEAAKDSGIVKSLNAAYQAVRHEAQPTGAVLPPGYYGIDAGHLLETGKMEGVACGAG